ncbi:MAG: putative selenium-dependent hydroxylase accessory protein YqeC [Oscillospiraceae bacterium]|nr:putative selenium-dependent hydroxylase accessory protein YqeC [Oscillospiraceae bacterium]
MGFAEALCISKGLTAIIGGGGKTSLLMTLARELSRSVILCTSTRIFPPEGIPTVEYVTGFVEDILCVGTPAEHGKLGRPSQSFEGLCRLADYVLVEADGSKHLPLKAHLDFEPVIPIESTQIITVVGVDCVGKKLEDATHRCDKACELLACNKEDVITEKMVAQLINTENLHDKVLINKCDSVKEKTTAELISGYIKTECVISSLLKGEWYVSSN